MTDRRPDAVDAYLDALGSAPVPGGLTAGVMARVHAEGPRRTTRWGPWLAAAATFGAVVLVGGLAVIAGGPGPSPSPAPIVSSPTAPTPSLAPTLAPTVAPTPGPAYFSTTLVSEGTEPVFTLDLVVEDRSGTLVDAVGLGSAPGAIESGASTGSLGIGPGPDDRSVVVAVTAFGCDYRARLEVGTDGRTLHLRFPPRRGCDAVGIQYRLLLTFDHPVSGSTFTSSEAADLVGVSDVAVPLGIAFVDAQHGYTAWRTEPGDAVVLETEDGGATWNVHGLGAGTITALAVAGDGTAWAGVVCPEGGMQGCSAGRYRKSAGDPGWGQVDSAWPISLSFAGQAGAGLFASEETPLRASGLPIADLAVTEDGGESWTVIRSPCGEADATDVTRSDASTVVVLCSLETGGSPWKRLLAGPPDGSAWRELSSTENGTLPLFAGHEADVDMVGRDGWLRIPAGPMLVTTDGGATWVPSTVGTGEDVFVSALDLVSGGAGAVLVDSGPQTLSWTDDGTTWTSRFEFPQVPCCGG